MTNKMITVWAVLGFLAGSPAAIGAEQNANLASAQEQESLEKALYCMEILENRPEMEIATRLEVLRNDCFAEGYVQHSPHVADGKDAVLKVFERRYERFPLLTSEIKRSAVFGDLVWIHAHVKNAPEKRGVAVINIFRMEDGKFAEHWNVVQAVPAESKNDNTMF